MAPFKEMLGNKANASPKHNVTQQQNLGLSVHEVPPNWNEDMEKTWIEIYSKLPLQGGHNVLSTLTTTVVAECKKILASAKYKDKPLWPVSYGRANL